MFTDVERYNVSSIAFRVIFSVSLAIVEYQKNQKLQFHVLLKLQNRLALFRNFFIQKVFIRPKLN